MAKRKYTDDERERLGIGTNKRKGSGAADRTLKIRREYLDWDDPRVRRRSSDIVRQDDGSLSWIGAMIVGGIFLVLLMKVMGA